MSSICHGIWVVRQYDILVLTNDNYILLMTRPMPGPWQTISQSDETIEVDISTRGWRFQHFDLVTQNCQKLFRCRRVANSRPSYYCKNHFTDDTINAWTLTNNFSVRWNNWSWHFYTWMVVSAFWFGYSKLWKTFQMP